MLNASLYVEAAKLQNCASGLVSDALPNSTIPAKKKVGCIEVPVPQCFAIKGHLITTSTDKTGLHESNPSKKPNKTNR